MGLLIDNKIPQDLIIAGKIVSSIYVNNEKIWPEEVTQNYLTFTALEDTRYTLTNLNKSPKVIEYSTNGGLTWFTHPTSSKLISKGKTWIYRSNDTLSMEGFRFEFTQGKVEVSGSLASLMNNDITLELTSNCFYRLFNNAPITSVPELPWTKLAPDCYYEMFYGCEYLTSLPNNFLPATTLASRCYLGMFWECTGLKNLPENLLHATILDSWCCQNMFYGCTSLTNAPALPATTLARSCYEGMFYGCVNLETAPELPATTLAPQCYSFMFANCDKLTNAPELPATELAVSCYAVMFLNCTSLTTGPDLPAEKIELSAYDLMFGGCSNLSSIKCNAMYDEDDNILESYIADYWMEDVKNTSECIFYKNPNWDGPTERGDHTVQSEWQIADWNTEPKYLKFTALSSGVIGLTFPSPNSKEIKYRKNNGQWVVYPTYATIRIPVSTGDTVEFMSENNTPISKSMADYRKFITEQGATFSVSGDLMSLVNFNHIPTPYCFYGLFSGCDIVNTPTINKAIAADHEFAYMFANCSKLTDITNISFAALSTYSCSQMFANSAITKIPSTIFNGHIELEDYSMHYMFGGCKNLTIVPYNLLYNQDLAPSCYEIMFSGCSKILNGPELPATELAEKCYSGMFYNCNNLIVAPELPATTLAKSCYNNMFNGCTSLTTAPALHATSLASSCYAGMFQGCVNLETAPELPSTELAERCYANMFYRCLSLTTTPNLPAITLSGNCYNYMFYGCSNLSTVYCKAMYNADGSLITDNIGTDWLRNVSAEGIFYYNADWDGPTVWNANTVPVNWTMIPMAKAQTYKFDLGTGKYYNEAGEEISDLGVFTLADGITYGTYSFARTSADQETYKFNACEQNYNTTTITAERDMYVINKDINIKVVECVFFRAGTNTGNQATLRIGSYVRDYVDNYRCSGTYSSSNYGMWPDFTLHQPGEVSKDTTIKMELNTSASNKSYGMYGKVTFEM